MSAVNGDHAARIVLSACIIARDEAENLPDCLAALTFCDEIVLIDSGSRDGTPELARAAGALVIENPWRGFAAQRNVALDHARGDWVLEIDADERVSPELRAEIQHFVSHPPAGTDLAGLPLRDVFLGRPLGRSAKYPKYRHRLLRRGAYRHDERRTVHEGFIPEGPVHPFRGDLVHILARTWSEAHADMWRYARLEAAQLRAPRTPAAFVKGAFVRPAAKFLYRLTVDGGWRDGWAGLAKIYLDCAGDSIVWLLHAAGLRGEESGDSGVAGNEHYGSWKARRGPLRIVAVANGASDSAAAARWLEAAAARGADVSLISRSAPLSGVRSRAPEGRGPLALIRALDAEEQLRTIDGVVAFGRGAERELRLVPPALRGHMGELSSAQDPALARWDAQAREAVGAA